MHRATTPVQQLPTFNGSTARRWALRSGLVGCALALFVVTPTDAHATPFYAVQAANACNTCHVEPVGWANPERVLD